MKQKILRTILIFSIAALFTTCEKSDNNIPYSDKDSLDPSTWAPQNLQIENVSITERKLTWDYTDQNIEGFKLDRKKGNEAWQVSYQTFSKETRSWIDTEIVPDPSLTFSYRLYAFAGSYNSSTKEIFTRSPDIGETYAGGIVFYLDENGGGLVCAESDQSTNAKWGCSEIMITGGTGKGIGAGAANTVAILESCSETGIAAWICYELVLNGHNDWFLPSLDELNLMYENLKLNGIGGFASDYYWSSFESCIFGADCQSFDNGTRRLYAKSTGRYVRAVRAF